MLVVTDGSKGTWDPALTPEQLVAARHAEQRAAADELGATEVVMLGSGRRGTRASVDLRRELTGWIRRLPPRRGADPRPMEALHAALRSPGHRVRRSRRGGGGARPPLLPRAARHRRGEAPTSQRLLWAADEPDHYEDIAETADRKVAALLRHSSQAETTMGDALGSDEAKDAFEERLRGWAAQQGGPAGLALAESFKRLTP